MECGFVPPIRTPTFPSGMSPSCAGVFRRFRVAAAGGALGLAPALLPAQAAAAGSTVGLRGVGALAVQGGYARVERGLDAVEASATLDLGHFASNRVRLAADLGFLRTLPFSEFIVADDTTYRNVFYDLSGHVVLKVLASDPSRGVVPWVSLGAGVHVLTSTFGSIPIDVRYNTNVFGLRAATGVRVRAGSSGRRALVIEASALAAREVNRVGVRAGMEWLFGDLVRR